ncbi:MAG: hypothetical protein HY011_08755 [Acidobacteria bacterium]|nr:hypothetical protein [Acidobacteriota bacterium]
MIKELTVNRQMMNDPTVKPPRISSDIEWSPKSCGWDCRFVYYEDKRRRRRHLGHLTSRKLEAIPETERQTVVTSWVQEKKLAKGVSL